MAFLNTQIRPGNMSAQTSLGLLDLPVEIRNQIYQNALSFESQQYYGSRTCSVALLATCKQVQNEAQEFLYSENEIIVRLATPANARAADVTLTANGRDISYRDLDRKLQVRWPAYLLRIGRIRIGCSFNHRNDAGWRGHMMSTVNNILYDLNYFLLGNPHLGMIRIDVTNNAGAANSEFIEMVSPLCLFGERAQLDFQGLPCFATQRLLEDSTEFDPNARMNVFEVYRKLRREAFECLSLCAESMPLPKSVLVAQDLLLRTEKLLPSTGRRMTVSADKNLKQHLCELDNALSWIDFDAVAAAPQLLKSPTSGYLQTLARLRSRQMLTRGASWPVTESTGMN